MDGHDAESDSMPEEVCEGIYTWSPRNCTRYLIAVCEIGDNWFVTWLSKTNAGPAFLLPSDRQLSIGYLSKQMEIGYADAKAICEFMVRMGLIVNVRA